MPIQAPQWTDFLSCPICMYEFAVNIRPPISLACGHTICRTCLATLHRQQCPFDQTTITKDLDNLPINYALLQLVTPPSSSSSSHNNSSNSNGSNSSNNSFSQDADLQSASVQNLNPDDLQCYKLAKKCIEELALYLKPYPNGNVGLLSRPMQRKLVTLVNCQLMEDEGRSRSLRAARSLGERTVTELILQHQNPQQLSTNLWAAVGARGCQFLGPAMQEEVLKLVLLALEDGSALSRKVLVMFVVQRLEPHFPQASKTSIGHVVQLLYRASCFEVSKREGDSSLMQLKEEFRTYDALRREHDAQIVQIATEAGLRIAPDQWSALLYGDSNHKSHMQSIIDKLQTPQSFAQSVQELVIALQRTGDPAKLSGLRVHLKLLASIDPSAESHVPSWEECAKSLDAVKQVVDGLVDFVQHHGNRKLQDPNHILHNSKYKVSFCRDLSLRRSCPRGPNCTFAHSEEELERHRAKLRRNPPSSRPKEFDHSGSSGTCEEVSPRFQSKHHHMTFRYPGPIPGTGPSEKSPNHLHVPIKSPYPSTSPVLTNPNSPNLQHSGNTRFTYNAPPVNYHTSPPPMINGNLNGMNRNFRPPANLGPPIPPNNSMYMPPPPQSQYSPDMYKNYQPYQTMLPPTQVSNQSPPAVIPSNPPHQFPQQTPQAPHPPPIPQSQPTHRDNVETSNNNNNNMDLSLMNPYMWKEQQNQKSANCDTLKPNINNLKPMVARGNGGPGNLSNQASPNKYYETMVGRQEMMKFDKQRMNRIAPNQPSQMFSGIKEDAEHQQQKQQMSIWDYNQQNNNGNGSNNNSNGNNGNSHTTKNNNNNNNNNGPSVVSGRADNLYHIDTSQGASSAKENFIRSDSILASQTADDDFPFDSIPANNKYGAIGNIPVIKQQNPIEANKYHAGQSHSQNYAQSDFGGIKTNNNWKMQQNAVNSKYMVGTSGNNGGQVINTPSNEFLNYQKNHPPPQQQQQQSQQQQSKNQNYSQMPNNYDLTMEKKMMEFASAGVVGNQQQKTQKTLNTINNNLYNLSIKDVKMPSNASISLDNFSMAGKASVTIPSQMSAMAIPNQQSGSLWNSEFSNGNKLWSNGKNVKASDDSYDDSLANGIRERELLNLLDEN